MSLQPQKPTSVCLIHVNWAIMRKPASQQQRIRVKRTSLTECSSGAMTDEDVKRSSDEARRKREMEDYLILCEACYPAEV